MIDNFEMTGLCQSGAGDISGQGYLHQYGSAQHQRASHTMR